MTNDFKSSANEHDHVFNRFDRFAATKQNKSIHAQASGQGPDHPPVPYRHTMELALQRPPAVLILAQLLLSDLDRNLIIKPFAEELF